MDDAKPLPIFTNTSPYDILSYADTNMRSFSNRFFRATIKTN